jgi:hypothetical protein
VFVADDVRVVQLLHDVDLLVDVFLQEGFLLDVQLADDLDGVERVRGFCVEGGVLLRASITSPNAPLPMDFMI